MTALAAIAEKLASGKTTSRALTEEALGNIQALMNSNQVRVALHDAHP